VKGDSSINSDAHPAAQDGEGSVSK
jgi:hypothetical protein